MADISSLGNLQPSEALDLDTYKDAGEGRPFPKKGRYVVQAPDKFTFGKTAAGALSAQIDPTVVGPDNEGFTVRYCRISNKTFRRGDVTVSQFGDYLRACGRRGSLSSDPATQADAVESTAGQTYEVELDWRVWEKDTGFSLEGMEKFPSDGNGGHLPYVPSPTQKDENGDPVILRANLFVRRFIPAAA